MTLSDFVKRNTYPSEETFSTYRLMAKEFAALGCDVEKIGRVTFVEREGKTCFLLESETSFTSLLAYRILKDKDLAKRVFRRAGLSVADGDVFSKKEKARARQRLADIGPSVIKPADSNKGRGVSVNVTEETFDAAWSAATSVASERVLIERYFADGDEARYLVVDGSCVAVARRIPPAIVGDGSSTIKQLIAQQNEGRKLNPDMHNVPIEIDAHRASIIESQGCNLASIPRMGRKIIIDWKANISTGGEPQNITEEVHNSMRKVAERVAHAVPGLDVVGVDILAKDHSAEATTGNYIIVEANTRPGLGMHHFPVFGRPINVCKLIAESCVRRMGFDVPVSDEAELPSLHSKSPVPKHPNSVSSNRQQLRQWQRTLMQKETLILREKAGLCMTCYLASLSLLDARYKNEVEY